MGAVLESLYEAATGIARPGTVTTVLLAGMAVVVIALLVLMRTRWGEAKPLSKCMALSIFAHLLLIVYAYYMQTFVAVPLPGREEVVQVTLIAPTEEEEPEPPVAEPVPAQREPWNEFPSMQPSEPPPETPDAARAPIEPPFEPQREREPAAVAMTAPDFPDIPDVPPDRPLPVPVPLDQTVAQPLPPAIEDMPKIEPPAVQSAEPARPLMPEIPQADEPSRLVRVDDALVPDRDTPAELPLDLLAGTVAMQQISAAATSASSPVRQLPEPEPIARRVADGTPLPSTYQNRTADNRHTIVVRNGGNTETEAAVRAALAWLAANQEADGRWNARRHGAGQEGQVLGHDRGGAGGDADTGVSGLAILAFLGTGQSHLDGEHQDTVRRGLEFLLRSQAADGNLAGQARLFARMYCHGIAALAISEAYAMTGDARLRPFVERAMRYTVRAQNANDGGWRYLPGDAGDMSQFGWQLMAIKSAGLAGVAVPDATQQGMRRFLDSTSTGRFGGLAAYRPHGPPTATMTAEALFCRLFMDAPRSSAATREAVELLMQETPRSGEINLYYWYYATIALFQLQGPEWEVWNQHLQQRLLAAQATSGVHAGSWSPKTVWGGYGGRVYTTAMAALCLEVYYRYLPMFDSSRP
ncbi:MAG: squalene--hopene cyclase [Pirellulaceae bacterium]|nr:squalene--hopene cyclase [Pirellulaceae bacterium]